MNKIGHKPRCKCRVCCYIGNKSDEVSIRLLEKYYLKALKKCTRFSKFRKKMKKRLFIVFKKDLLINPVSDLLNKQRIINCKKCGKVNRSLPGYRFKCITCVQAQSENMEYTEWQTWGHSVIL